MFWWGYRRGARPGGLVVCLVLVLGVACGSSTRGDGDGSGDLGGASGASGAGEAGSIDHSSVGAAGAAGASVATSEAGASTTEDGVDGGDRDFGDDGLRAQEDAHDAAIVGLDASDDAKGCGGEPGAVTLVTTVSVFPHQLLVDGDRLYFATAHCGPSSGRACVDQASELFVVPACGGAPELVHTMPWQYGALLDGGDYLYAVQHSQSTLVQPVSAYRIHKTSHAAEALPLDATVLTRSEPSQRLFAANATDFVYYEALTGNLLAISSDGDQPRVLATPSTPPSQVGVTEDDVIWTDATTAYRAPLHSSASPEVLLDLTGYERVGKLLSTSGAVYALAPVVAAPDGVTVLELSASGSGESIELPTSLPYPILWDAGFFYYEHTVSRTTVYRVPFDETATPSPVLENHALIAVGGGAIYSIEREQPNGDLQIFHKSLGQSAL